MSKVIIFHGTHATPDVAWYPWLAEKLTEEGHFGSEFQDYPTFEFLSKLI